MQSNNKFKRQLEKLESKLAFLQKAYDHELPLEQKEWIKKNLILFNQLFQIIKGVHTFDEYTVTMAEDLYKNVQNAKKKIISWMKFKSTDIQVFKNFRKEKPEGWISLIDMVLPPPMLPEIREVDLVDLNFPCMSYTNQELCTFSEMIFKEQNVLSEFNLSSEKLNKIIEQICHEYNVPAYHNFSHGFNVFQMFYSILKKTELGRVLNKLEIFASLLGSLGHDLNHRGYNNLYEAKLKTKNSMSYFDTSILENMHASTLIKILKDPNINFFDCLPDAPKKAQFKDIATTVILATDMSKHNKLLQKFTDGVKATTEYRKLKAENQQISDNIKERAFIMDRAEDKRIVLKNIVHACDIGNPCQIYENYMYWAALITHEFNYQTKKEEKRGVEVTGFLKFKDLSGFYGGQIFFTKTLVLPLWEQIHILFEGIEEVMRNLCRNLKRLEDDMAKTVEN